MKKQNESIKNNKEFLDNLNNESENIKLNKINLGNKFNNLKIQISDSLNKHIIQRNNVSSPFSFNSLNSKFFKFDNENNINKSKNINLFKNNYIESKNNIKNTDITRIYNNKNDRENHIDNFYIKQPKTPLLLNSVNKKISNFDYYGKYQEKKTENEISTNMNQIGSFILSPNNKNNFEYKFSENSHIISNKINIEINKNKIKEKEKEKFNLNNYRLTEKSNVNIKSKNEISNKNLFKEISSERNINHKEISLKNTSIDDSYKKINFSKVDLDMKYYEKTEILEKLQNLKLFPKLMGKYCPITVDFKNNKKQKNKIQEKNLNKQNIINVENNSIKDKLTKEDDIFEVIENSKYINNIMKSPKLKKFNKAGLNNDLIISPIGKYFTKIRKDE